MKFEIGKYYRHTSGHELHIVSAGKTTLYGWTMFAESNKSCDIMCVGSSEDNAENYLEILEEDWMRNFSK